MMLRAVVIGTGWAGEGHTVALRAAGVEVVAMCGRTPAAAQAMAAKLGVSDVRFDWREVLEELRPDIVAIATTAAPHHEMACFAAQIGCHVLCDKPLGLNATEAKAMLVAVEEAGVKHAYAASSCYDPHYLYARELLARGLVGRIREIDSVMYFLDSPYTPHTWFHNLALGGGMLNNVLTHQLGQICKVTGCRVMAAVGEAKCLIERAPVGPPIHDFRDSFEPIPLDQVTEWREVDADLAYTVMLQLEMPDGAFATALCKCSSMAKSRNPGQLTFYGETGTLHLSGAWKPNRIEHFDNATDEWQELPVPPHIYEAFPQVDNHVQSDWNQLCREFVADIQGNGATTYPTFRDGWVHNQVIDIARSGSGWTAIDALAARASAT